MILIVNFMLKDPFAIARKLYQESLKRRTTSKEFYIKLPPEVIDIPGCKAGILIVLSNTSDNITGRKALLKLLLNIRRLQYSAPS